jgi:Iap family predicted aminopeptidase
LQPDGVPNLLEYALAMDPRAPDAHLAQVQTHIVENAGTPSLEITFRRNPDATDLQFLLEASSNLAAGQWTIVTPDASGPATPDTDGTPRHTFRMDLGNEPAFYRVRIEPVP